MGRCLMFNFNVQQLQEKMKDVKYFLYRPDLDNGGAMNDQSFDTAVRSSGLPIDQLIAAIQQEL